MKRRSLATAAALLLVGALASPSLAHFVLIAPPSYAQQDAVGNPQKSAPCGQADPGISVVPTGQVAQVEEGSTLTITFNEAIFHPGHYRVAIAQDQAGLPADPPVTAGSTACGSTTIEPNPTLPLLADGLLVHTSPLSGTQTLQVQLPAGMTCENCVLQVTEFMSNHGLNNPGGCFYHHCATVSVVPPGTPDAGPGAGGADAGEPGVDEGSGGGCASRAGGGTCVPTGGLWVAGVLLLGLLVLRRRRGG